MTPPDQAVRRRITHDGLDETLFVEAGAGTGKTTQLVDRIANLVIEQGVPLAGIAAITFTEAAAAELADRIRVCFERQAAATADDEVRRRCRAAIADADRAAISTLHSFAGRILAEHPLAGGLPPRVGVLDDISSELAREARWERFVDALYDDPANEGLLVRAAMAGVVLERRYSGQATMKDVAAVLGQSWDLLDAVVADDRPPLADIDYTAFDEAVDAAAALADACTDDKDRLLKRLNEVLLPDLRAIQAMTDPDRKFGSLKAGAWGPTSVGGKYAFPCGIVAARQVIYELNDARDAVVGDVVDDVLARLLTHVAREVQGAAEARRLEGNLEYHDLLVLARRLLRTSPAARRALHGRYTHLLLDEFQDTDPIQIELAVLIATSVQGDDPPVWDEALVDGGRLFFVGDPKQSIYRFRRADIELFLKARERFGPGGTWLRLTTNFRTVEPILGWVNTLFARLMEEVEGKQPKYEDLVADRASSDDGEHRPVLLGGPHPKANALELREAEAADVARTIAHIGRHPDAWPVFDDEARDWRPGRLTDVTILVPTRTSLAILRAALEGRDIPYRLNTGTLVYDTQEVRDALAALAAVDDPTDELSLVTALRSPLYACADTDLFTWQAAGGRWDMRRDPPDGVAAEHPVAAALAHLHLLWKQRWWLRPSVLLDRLLRERGAYVLAFGEGQASEVWGRLRFLVDQARAFEEAGGGGLRPFLEWAALQRSESSRVHEPVLPETDDHAVRIMTIHSAKGLEFPITILSGLTTKPGNRRTGVSVIWDGERPEVKLRKGVATANHNPRADLEAEMDRHEKIRLLYVAATRARDHLVVACHHQENDESYAGLVWREMQAHVGLWRTLPADEEGDAVDTAAALSAPKIPAPPATDERDEWLAAREALLAPQRRPRFVSATAIAREAGVAARADEGDSDDRAGPGDLTDDADLPVAPRRRGRAGSAIGRAVHATLQFTDLADPAGIDAQAARQADLEAIPDHATTITAMARSALASDAVQLAAKGRYHKEIYVAAPVGERVIEGYIDLLVETPEGLVIVDYKTGTVASETDVDAKLAIYELQGAAYAVALEESTGMPVVDCRFVFCRPAGAIERGVADLGAAKERVRRQLDG